jgi:branched-chain amino acid transport system ATP-binding protein
MTVLLEATAVCAGYGRVNVLQRVSIRLAQGQLVSVIGPNGAGKTTLLSALMGVLPSTGTIRFAGEDLAGVPVTERVRRGISLVPERRELFASMPVEDNLRLGAYSRHRRGARDLAATLEETYVRFPRLRERRSQAAGTLSGGERQMLAIGRALMNRPRLLLLDEPSLGLAPLITREIFRIIAELRDSGGSILVVEQNARAALQLSEYGYVLEMGAVAFEGPSVELSQDRRVVESYLGLAKSALPA